jgi:hypothetical protein
MRQGVAWMTSRTRAATSAARLSAWLKCPDSLSGRPRSISRGRNNDWTARATPGKSRCSGARYKNGGAGDSEAEGDASSPDLPQARLRPPTPGRSWAARWSTYLTSRSIGSSSLEHCPTRSAGEAGCSSRCCRRALPLAEDLRRSGDDRRQERTALQRAAGENR